MKNVYQIFIIVLGLLTTKALTAQEFITIWTPSSGEITIPTNASYTYDFNIEWYSLDGPTPVLLGSDNNISSFYTIPNLSSYNTIEVRITGDYPLFRMRGTSQTNKSSLIDVKQWGTNQWESFESAFFECDNVNFTATDSPDLSLVTDMNDMFSNASGFNSNIGSWDVSNIETMQGMFANASSFNQNIGNWTVDNVTEMFAMFANATDFNQDIGNWNVSGVIAMTSMFEGAEAFNQDIGSWDVSNVTDMVSILKNATFFNQSLEDWAINSLTYSSELTLTGCGMSCENLSRTLYSWSNNTSAASGITLAADNLTYSDDQAVVDAVSFFDTQKNWTNTATEGNCSGTVLPAFISVWEITSPDLYAYVPATGDYTYYYIELDGNGDEIPFTENGSNNYDTDTIFFSSPGTYRISVTQWHALGNPIHRINFNNAGDKDKIITIEQWGNYMEWTSFETAYYGCANLDISAADVPNLTNVTNTSYAFAETGLSTLPNFNLWDLSNVTNMSYMFKGVNGFMPDMENWDVSNVTDMSGMFASATDFNQDISGWDVSNVTNMSNMFDGASNFDQDLSGWDVSNVTDMSFMFQEASSISNIGPVEGEYHSKANGIDNWDVGQVTNMEGMFSNAIQFNGDIGNWDVGQVTNMSSMFSGAAQFNADLSSWDVSNVTDMSYMFTGATSITSIGQAEGDVHSKANGVDNWDVGQVTSMTDMFSGAISFNGDLGNWDVGQLTANGISGSNDISFANSGMSCGNYSLTLQGWANQSNTPLNIVVDATGMNYSPDVVADRDILINDNSWTFKGDNEDSNCFLSIDEFQTASFTIYPNPAQEQFTIAGLSGNETIQLVDMTGRVLQTIENKINANKSIDVSLFANGVYNVVIITENGGKSTQKIIKY